MIPAQSSFANIDGPQAVYLTAGTHVLKVALGNTLMCLNSITFTSAAAPTTLTPRIVSLPQITDEVVVADAVVTDSPFNADSTGVNDCTTAVQNAIDTVWKRGGGTVVIPAGMYRVDGTLLVRENVTIRGDWKSPLNGGSGAGTILKASSGLGNENGTSFIKIDGPNAGVRGLSIWYPDQHYSSSTIHPYPYTIEAPDYTWGAAITNITLYNSYNGILVTGGSATTVGNIYGTALKNGVIFGNCWEYSYVYNITIENSIWKNAPTSVITNAPTSATDRADVDSYTSENRIGLQLGQFDGGQVYGISIKESWKDVYVKKLTGDDHAFYGNISKVTGDIEQVDLFPAVGNLLTDNIPETSTLSYTFASHKKPASTSNFYNVMNSPYNAKGDGITDDTSAIQSALNAAGSAGGGTVYMPVGLYKISTHLSVPSGVELRGPFGAPHPSENLDTCMLLAYEGKDTGTPDSDTAFITLAANSGVRGFTINYPDQGYGSASAPVHTFPYTIRGNGSGIWVDAVNMLNSYMGVDFNTYSCSNHLIMETWATALSTGFNIGGGSSGGVMERTVTTFGNWYQTFKNNAPHEYGVGDIKAYCKNNTKSFRYQNCTGETTYGVNSFWVYLAFDFVNNGTGCTNSTFWHPSSDCSKYAGYALSKGDNIKFIGMASGSSEGNWFRTEFTFTGTANIYGKYLWANTFGKSINGGTVNIYSEKTLTSNQPAIANGDYGGDVPSRAVDMYEPSKWCNAYAGTNWLRVDLGQISEIQRWVVKNAGMAGDPVYYNSKNIQLQNSLDDTNFLVVDGLDNNTADFVDRNFAMTDARFVRLVVYDGTQPGYDHYARIHEFEVYGKPGWHFNLGTERWTAVYQVANFAASNGRLKFTSTGTDPQINSPDNMGNDCSKHKKVKVKMKNSTASTVAQLFFSTYTDPTFTEAKSAVVTAVANDPIYTEYVFDFTNNSSWTGQIKQLRFDPTTTTGDISIEYIMLTN